MDTLNSCFLHGDHEGDDCPNAAPSEGRPMSDDMPDCGNSEAWHTHRSECFPGNRRIVAPPAAATTPAATARYGVYIASKTKHAAKWKALRDSGVPIISTWIDEAGEGETKSYEDLWRRCISEAMTAERFVIYAEPGEILKGALVEMGAAIAAGTPVFSVGDIGKPLWESILTTKCASIEDAIKERRVK